MKICWNERYCHPLPEGHRFPMEKYNLIPEQLLYEGTITSSDLIDPGTPQQALFELAHTSEYLDRLVHLNLSPAEVRRIGFPQSALLVQRELEIMQGTLKAVEFAFQDGVAFNMAGGTHHAFADAGEGFCLLNDLAIAAAVWRKQKKVMIVDLDVHQGNGTASICQSWPEVFTFSMHCGANFPLRKEESNFDVALPAGTGDSDYLTLLGDHLTRIMNDFEPELVLYQAGVDVLATDKLGKLKLSMEACRRRDDFVLALCKKNKVPLVVTLGGGYSTNIRHIIEAHAQTFRLAQFYWF